MNDRTTTMIPSSFLMLATIVLMHR
jgi:hypothetical protein